MLFRAYGRTVSFFEGLRDWLESLEVFKKYSDFRDSRKVLFSINLIIAVCSLCLSGFSAYLAALLYDPNFFSTWINWMGLSIVGVSLAVTCIVGMRGAHLVSLDLLLTYFWGITVFVAPLLLGIVACFDFYSYLNVFFQHQWEESNFVGIRNLFCPPQHPAIDKCAAPLFGAEAWCKSHFNATDCWQIRTTAIQTSFVWAEEITLGEGITAIVDLVLIGGSLFFCYRLLKRNVIAQSMNDVINYLLMLPIGGCIGLAYYLWWLQAYPPSRLQYSWLATLFAALAGAQICALPLGIAAGRLKSKRLLIAYMLLILCISTGLALGGTISLLFAGLIGQTFKPSAVEIGDIACRKELNGCCCCDAKSVVDGGTSINRCPQWQTEEVLSLLVLDLKISGIVAFVSLLYLFGAMIVAFLVQQSLENYKVDYIGVGKTRGADGELARPVAASSLTQSLSATVGTAGNLVVGAAADFAGGVQTVSSGLVEGVGMVGGAVYGTVGGVGESIGGVLRSSIEGRRNGGKLSTGAAGGAFGGSFSGALGGGSDSSRRTRPSKESRQVQWAEEAPGSSASSSLPPVPLLPPQLGVLGAHRHRASAQMTESAQRELDEWLEAWQREHASPLMMADVAAQVGMGMGLGGGMGMGMGAGVAGAGAAGGGRQGQGQGQGLGYSALREAEGDADPFSAPRDLEEAAHQHQQHQHQHQHHHKNKKQQQQQQPPLKFEAFDSSEKLDDVLVGLRAWALGLTRAGDGGGSGRSAEAAEAPTAATEAEAEAGAGAVPAAGAGAAVAAAGAPASAAEAARAGQAGGAGKRDSAGAGAGTAGGRGSLLAAVFGEVAAEAFANSGDS